MSMNNLQKKKDKFLLPEIKSVETKHQVVFIMR